MITKATILKPPMKGLISLLTKSHDPPSRRLVGYEQASGIRGLGFRGLRFRDSQSRQG